MRSSVTGARSSVARLPTHHHHSPMDSAVPDTPTLELPRVTDAPLTEPTLDEPTLDAMAQVIPAEASADAFVESEPTTLTMPVVGTAELVVIEEPSAGTRSQESLSVSPRRARIALVTLAASAFAAGVNEASIVAMSPHIARGLDASVASVGLLVTAFSATVVLATLPLTLVTQRLGKRATLTATLAVWSIGVAVAAIAQSLPQLATGRIISAAAHALFWALVAPTAVSLFAPHLRGRTVTRVMVGSAMAGVVGTPLVTMAGANLSWRLPYIVLAGLGVVLAVTLAFALPRSGPGGGAGTHTRGDIPSTRAFARVLVVAFLAVMAMSTTWTYIVSFYTRQSGVPSAAVPVMFAIGGVVAVAATLSVGPLLSRRVVETVIGALTLLILAWGVLSIGHQVTAVIAQVLQAAGWASLVAALLNWAMRHTPWRTDIGAATYTVVFSLGGAIGPVVGSTIVAEWGTRALPLMSLFLTAMALGVATRVDRRTIRKLHVPRRARRRSVPRRSVLRRPRG